MPHIVVKLYPGRTEAQKTKLAEKIAQDVVEIAGCKSRSVSVAIEEVPEDQWTQNVFKPCILDNKEKLYVEPGYNPFEDESQETVVKEDLMTYVRNAAAQAQAEDETGYFNPMSWLDLELEDNPARFDSFFDTPWSELSDNEKQERAVAVRGVL